MPRYQQIPPGFGDPKSGQVMELAEAKCRDTTRVTTDCYIYTRSGWGTAIKSDPKIIIIPSINAREETDQTIQAQDLSIQIGAQNHHHPHSLCNWIEWAIPSDLTACTLAVLNGWLGRWITAYDGMDGGREEIRLIAINCLKINHSSPH